MAETANEQQLHPRDLWKWFSTHHWKHWHGARTQWWPLESRAAAKWHRCVRSFTPKSGSDGAAVVHQNQWYDARGPEGDLANFGHGPWVMEEELHSLPDGMLHPLSDALRFYQFPGGDLGWIRTSIGANGPILVGGEVQFMLPGNDGRLAVVLSLTGEGRCSASLFLEEVRDTDERPDPTWYGTVWKLDPLAELEDREQPDGVFVGEGMTMYPTLVLKTDKQARWGGFYHGLNEEHKSSYALVHLPNNVSCCVAKEAKVGASSELAFIAHWIVSEEQVRMIAWWYGGDGKFQKITIGSYFKQ